MTETAAASGSRADTTVPGSASTPRADTSVPGSASTPRADTTRLFMLALGDSYTIGQSVAATDRYPQQLVKKLCSNEHICFEEPQIIATTGWTTGNLLDALDLADLSNSGTSGPAPPGSLAFGPYQAVTLLIGVNNQFQGRSPEEYSTQFSILLQRSIALAGNQPAHVLVLSIPDYSVTPFGQSTGNAAAIARSIDSFNSIGRQLSMTYRVNWLDVTTESRKAFADPTLIAADGLHFSGKEYEIWARLMEPIVKEMVH
ncbi:MAG TPA: GDSL-type esterase/lipase family protein [Puia sp.]|nr:GDSL-type esterase/lipase family protein [Puia sp.]